MAEIESIATDDVIDRLGKLPAPLEAITETKTVRKRLTRSARTRGSQNKRAEKRKGGGSRKKPKTVIVQEALQGLLDAKDEARRDEVLAAAQVENPAITKSDLGNGLRILMKNDKIRVSSEDSGVILPGA